MGFLSFAVSGGWNSRSRVLEGTSWSSCRCQVQQVAWWSNLGLRSGATGATGATFTMSRCTCDSSGHRYSNITQVYRRDSGGPESREGCKRH